MQERRAEWDREICKLEQWTTICRRYNLPVPRRQSVNMRRDTLAEIDTALGRLRREIGRMVSRVSRVWMDGVTTDLQNASESDISNESDGDLSDFEDK